jgi:lysozyme family protein
VIGAIHFREAGSNFLGHLHNGDNLRQKTKNVPANHPPGPWPPNPWDARLAFRTSAIDALQKYKSVERWTVERALYTFESFNGFGYRDKNINSPYLWSYSDLYEKGGFPRDHYYDSNWVSKQAGLGLVIRAVSNAALNENILTFET